jgi:hypothetical protein
MTASIEQIVNRQILKWQRESQIADRSGTEPAPAPQKPMICISREYRSRGSEIGKRVAERLGFQLYGHELVDQIAEQAHVRRRVIESVDERTQRAIDNFLGEVFGGGFFARSDYLRNLAKVVLTLGRHGEGVILGRGAFFILDPQYTLRVRTIAPLEVRVARVAAEQGWDPEKAKDFLRRIDTERSTFIRQHFGREVSDPGHYDLVLNTGSFSEETCADLVVQAFRARFGSPR